MNGGFSQVPGRRTVLSASVIAILPLLVFVASAQGQQEKAPKLGKALLQALDAPEPPVKRLKKNVPPGARGVVQRTRLDFSQAHQSIQLAFVIDATQSMELDIASLSAQLNGIVQRIEQIVRSNRNSDQVDIEVAIVVYRDVLRETDEGRYVEIDPVEIPSGRFRACAEAKGELEKAFAKIEKRSGVPAYPEQVDRGLHAALTRLEWDPHEDVTRLIILAGDAPPWDEAYMEPGTTPRWQGLENTTTTLRGYSDEQLIGLANEKDIQISSVLCNTGFEVSPVIQDFQNEFRRFLDQLAARTQGQFLDLWDDSTVVALATSTVGPTLSMLQELENVSTREVEERRQQEEIRVAVLPPLPLTEMRFRGHGANMFAGGVQLKLHRIDSQSVVDGPTIEKAWRTLTYDSDVDDSMIRKLAKKLHADHGVDFLLWGEYTERDAGIQVTLTAYDRQGEQAVVAGPIVADSRQELAASALSQLVKEMAVAGTSGRRKAATFASIYGSPEQEESLMRRLVNSDDAYDALISGRQALEQAAAFQRDEESEGQTLTREAQRYLEHSNELEPGHPLTLLLLANCEFNLENTAQAKAHLQQAYEARPPAGEDAALRLEIEADYLLFVKDSPVEAIRQYRSLVDTPELSRSQAALRARWMLAGLYLGDWQSEDEMRQAFPNEDERLALARDCILDVLIRWPDSPQASFYAPFVKPRFQPRKSTNGLVQHDKGLEHKIAVPTSNRGKYARAGR